jgi:hypothetical protein
MFHHARVLCLLACVAGWSAPGLTQPVYRCSDNSYSNKPCPGGKEIQADDPRTAAQRAQTSDAARRDAKLADEMEKTRLKEEAKVTKPAGPVSAAEPPMQTASSDRTYSPFRAKKPQYFTAVSPRKAEAKAAKKKKAAKKPKQQPA